ncbi:MAG: 7-cyano-7-deazaguanine synthase, partial [Candidatus Omnitrophica bacterium]|nr:7-cyano-7-deazaguanine synthase [Candidatus Omnitrophota bacterium]
MAGRNRKAVVLLSGGLDSATTLYYALDKGFSCTCLSFDYGQRHRREIACAGRIARRAGCRWRLVRVAFPWKGSALLEKRGELPRKRTRGIPRTYVPGRNIIFLSYALSCAEAVSAGAVFIGAHSQDYSGYPDCRPEFIRAFESMARQGTRCGTQGRPIRIV